MGVKGAGCGVEERGRSEGGGVDDESLWIGCEGGTGAGCRVVDRVRGVQGAG